MSYEKLGFVSGQTLKAEHLNHMEEGIANAGGVSSWDELADKPFYSEIVEGAVPFDGDLTDKEYYDMGDFIIVKMSDDILTEEQLIGSTAVVKHNIQDLGATGDTTVEFIIAADFVHKQELDSSCFMIMAMSELEVPAVIVLKGDLSAALGVSIPEGTYFVYIPMDEEYCYTHYLSCINGMKEVIVPIDEKFVPNSIVRYDELPSVIIDVTELPASGIQNCLYRKFTVPKQCGLIRYNSRENNWTIDSKYIVECVEELPSKAENDEYHLYYDVKANKIYCFYKDAWRATSYIATNNEHAIVQDYYIVVDSCLYAYANGWALINPVAARGSGAFSNILNYCGNEASGDYSHAEGYNTTASGDYSHAEGYNTTAAGYCSHAEGRDSEASGYYSHAEGRDSEASGYYSHAEGGSSKAIGKCSHAEGEWTTASGDDSHAEGSHTIASGNCSHVQGKYNIEDTENKYAHIVGNGTAYSKLSNAHTLDWDGNAWFAGSVEGTAMIIKSPNGTRFQITVDDNGNLTATAIVEETETTA